MKLNRSAINVNLLNRSYDYESLVEMILNRIENVEDLIDDEKLFQAID